MKTIKPTYFDKFHCLAGDCSFTCCRDWDIAVDPATIERWKDFGIKTSDLLRPGLHDTCMKLKEDGTCLLLREDGLCSQVLAHGEESLSLTCHTYPRESHEFGDRLEQTLTMGCPQALRLLFAETAFSQVEEETLQAKSNPFEAADPALVLLRGKLIDLVQNQSFTPEEALRIGFLLLIAFYDREQISLDDITREFDGENLVAIREAIAGIQRDPYDHIMEQNELFLDLVENYRKKGIYKDLINPLAKTMEDLEDPGREKEFREERLAFEPLWKELEPKLCLLLAEEIYSTLYLPGGNLYTALLKFEWLGIFYAALKQAAFVSWKIHGELTNQALENLIILLIRMTGYSEDDIEEYLENSFEEIIWDWGYFALIV